jgi:hypothetical protein
LKEYRGVRENWRSTTEFNDTSHGVSSRKKMTVSHIVIHELL